MNHRDVGELVVMRNGDRGTIVAITASGVNVVCGTEILSVNEADLAIVSLPRLRQAEDQARERVISEVFNAAFPRREKP